MGKGYSNGTKTGYGIYNGTDYTEASPLVITAGNKVKLVNNAASTVLSQLPEGQDLWDPVTNKITPINDGDGYLLRVDFTAANTSNTGALELTLDIGGSLGEILARPDTFIRGTNIFRRFTSTSMIYSLGTFLANGGELFLESIRGTTSLYDLTIIISRFHEAK